MLYSYRFEVPPGPIRQAMRRSRRPRALALLLTVALIASACGSSLVSSGGGQEQPSSASHVAAATAPTAIATTSPIEFRDDPAAGSEPPPTATGIEVPTAQPPGPTSTAQPAAGPTAAAAVSPTATATAVAVASEPSAEPSSAPTALPPTAVPTAVPSVQEQPADDQSFGNATTPLLTRSTTTAGYVPLGQAGGVQLVLPAARVELVGFHEAGHPGAQGFEPVDVGIPAMVLETRNRNTDPRSALDIVVPPDETIRAPVTGTVVASSSYVLYCKYDDKLVYIEPDGLPGWQVRVFHIRGTTPAVGDRVVAGETQIADGAFLLPFESQVDEFTAEPSWAHVHVEVVDTSVPDTRPPGPGCP